MTEYLEKPRTNAFTGTSSTATRAHISNQVLQCPRHCQVCTGCTSYECRLDFSHSVTTTQRVLPPCGLRQDSSQSQSNDCRDGHGPPYEGLLTQKNIRLQHAKDCHDGWLARLDQILTLEHKSQGGFGFRAAKLRTWHRKTKVLEQIADDLVRHPIVNKVVPEKTVLWYGAASFSARSLQPRL